MPTKRDDKIASPVIFSVGITTFNREEELKKNLINIAKVSGIGIEVVYVVNHGAPLSFDPKTIFEHTIVIEQKNLGGAGGFTRTMIACLDRLGCDRVPTHHIIMDDDAIATPEMYLKTKQAVSFDLTSCFGGHMRNKENQNTIAEIGVRVSEYGEWQGIGRDIDINSNEARSLLESPVEIDAHAWWFWIVPVSVMQKISLPLPLFIKGDDIEYSYRSKMQGHKTYYMPEVHVIHPTISKKGSNWRFYYLARNIAIVASCSTGIYLPRHYALFRLVAALVRHEYYRVELEIIGLEHFLKGPALMLENSSDIIHENLLRQSSKLSAPPLVQLMKLPAPGEVKLSVYRYAFALFLSFFMKSDDEPKFCWRNSGNVDPIACLGKSYLVTVAQTGLSEKFDFDRREFLRLFIKILPIAINFALNKTRKGKSWSLSKSKLTSSEYWRSQFTNSSTD